MAFDCLARGSFLTKRTLLGGASAVVFAAIGGVSASFGQEVLNEDKTYRVSKNFNSGLSINQSKTASFVAANRTPLTFSGDIYGSAANQGSVAVFGDTFGAQLTFGKVGFSGAINKAISQLTIGRDDSDFFKAFFAATNAAAIEVKGKAQARFTGSVRGRNDSSATAFRLAGDGSVLSFDAGNTSNLDVRGTIDSAQANRGTTLFAYGEGKQVIFHHAIGRADNNGAADGGVDGKLALVQIGAGSSDNHRAAINRINGNSDATGGTDADYERAYRAAVSAVDGKLGVSTGLGSVRVQTLLSKGGDALFNGDLRTKSLLIVGADQGTKATVKANLAAEAILLDDAGSAKATLVIGGNGAGGTQRVTGVIASLVDDNEGTLQVGTLDASGVATARPNVTFDSKIGVSGGRLAKLDLLAGRAAFAQGVNVQRILVHSAEGTTFKGDVTANSFSLSAVGATATFAGAGNQTITGAITSHSRNAGTGALTPASGKGALVVNNSGITEKTVTFTDDIGTNTNAITNAIGAVTLTAGEALFRGKVFVKTLRVNSESSFKKDVTASNNFSFGAAGAKATFSGTANQTVTGAITAAENGQGAIVVNNNGPVANNTTPARNRVTFTGRIGTRDKAIGRLNLDAGLAEFKRDVSVQNLVVNAGAEFKGSLTSNRFSFGAATAKATFAGTSPQTITGAIAAAAKGHGQITVDGSNTVTFNDAIGAENAAVGQVTLNSGSKTTLRNSLHANKLTVGAGGTLTLHKTMFLDKLNDQDTQGGKLNLKDGVKLTLVGGGFTENKTAFITDSLTLDSGASVSVDVSGLTQGDLSQDGKFKLIVTGSTAVTTDQKDQFNILPVGRTTATTAVEGRDLVLDVKINGPITLETATDVTWAVSGLKTAQDNDPSAATTYKKVTHAVSGDKVQFITANNKTLTFTNDGTADDGNGNNLFVAGDITESGGSGNILITEGSANDLKVKIKSVNITGTDGLKVTRAGGGNDGVALALEVGTVGRNPGGASVAKLSLDNRDMTGTSGAQVSREGSMTALFGQNLTVTGTTELKAGKTGGSPAKPASVTLTTSGQKTVFTGAVTLTGGEGHADNRSALVLKGAQTVFEGGLELTKATVTGGAVAAESRLEISGTGKQVLAAAIDADGKVTSSGAITTSGSEFGQIIVNNSGAAGQNGVIIAATIGTASDEIGQLTITDGAAEFRGNVFAKSILAETADGVTFRRNVTATDTSDAFSFRSADAKVIFGATAVEPANQTVKGAITAQSNGQGRLVVDSKGATNNSVTFENDIGTDGRALGRLTLTDGVTTFEGKVFAQTLAVNSTDGTTFEGATVKAAVIFGRGAATANFEAVTGTPINQTITGPITAESHGFGRIVVNNAGQTTSGSTTTAKTVTFTDSIGTASRAIGSLTLTDGKTTFDGDVHANLISVNSPDGTVFKGNVRNRVYSIQEEARGGIRPSFVVTGSTVTFSGARSQTIAGALTAGDANGTLVVNNSGTNDETVTFAGQVGAPGQKAFNSLTLTDGATVFSGDVFAKTITVSTVDGATFRKNVTAETAFTFGVSAAKATFAGTEDQTIANAITAGTQNHGQLVVNNSGTTNKTVTFAAAIGASATEIGALTVTDGAALFNNSVFANKIRLDSADGTTFKGAEIKATSATDTFVFGADSASATFAGHVDQTVTGAITAATDGQGQILVDAVIPAVRNSSGAVTAAAQHKTVAFANDIGTGGTGGKALGRVTLTNGATTFSGNVFAKTIQVNSAGMTTFKGENVAAVTKFVFGAEDATATFSTTSDPAGAGTDQTITGAITAGSDGQGKIIVDSKGTTSKAVTFKDDIGTGGTGGKALGRLTLTDGATTFEGKVFCTDSCRKFSRWHCLQESCRCQQPVNRGRSEYDNQPDCHC